MTKPKLTYFDMPVSRGEECRLALHVAGVEFEDERLDRAGWMARKPNTPYGSVPTLELPGGVVLAHSNAILVYIGRRWDLHPKEDLEAARHEAMLCHVEDLRAQAGPVIRIQGDAEKKAARAQLVETTLPAWATQAEKNITGAPFFGGEKLNVVDLKVYMAVKWFAGGNVDHVPADVFSRFEKLNKLYETVRDDARIKAWYAR